MGEGKEIMNLRLRFSVQSWMIYAGYAVLAFLPLITGNFYYMRVGGLVALYLILALGLDIVAGEAGLLDLGYAAFYGIGAYTYALLASPQFGLHLPFFPAAACGICASALAALLVSIPTLHLKGDYLAMVTLGFGQIIRILLNNLDRPINITNGPNGIVAIDAPRILGVSFDSLEMSYVFIWVVAVAVVVIASRVVRSSIGRAWSAIREDPVAASCMGVNVARYRVAAFVWGAALAGLAGALFASWQRAIFPQNFTMQETITVYCMVVLGGLRSLPGIMLGTLVLVIIPEMLRAYSIYRMLIYGVALVLLAIYRPQGLIPQSAATVASSVKSMLRSPGIGRRRRVDTPAVSKPRDRVGEMRNLVLGDRVCQQPGHCQAGGCACGNAGHGSARARHAIEINDVACRFDGLTALSKISFNVKPGEVVGIIGPNGAGKTTLFNLLTGVVNPTSGRIEVLGNDVTNMPPHKIAELGVVRTFQNIRLFENQSVLENVLVGCHRRLKGDVCGAVLGTKEYRKRHAAGVDEARAALGFFGKDLASREAEPARDLSYPERRRVELARGLALAPRILLLDEPTAGMTPDEAEEVVQGICVLKEHGFTVLVIEHRMDVIAGACDRVIVLDHGEKIAEGTPGEVVANPEVIHAYLGTTDVRNSREDDSEDSRGDAAKDGKIDAGADVKRLDGIRMDRPSLQDEHASLQGERASLRDEQPSLPDEHIYIRDICPAVDNQRAPSNESLCLAPEPVLELRGVHSSYGSVKVLQGIDAEINAGELVVFLGSNASGKTTMLKTILGRVPPTSGEIRFQGARIDGMPTSEIARAGIGIVPEGRRIFPQLTVLENLELGGYVLKDRNQVAEGIDKALELFPRLGERRNQLAGTLSGGEQQMLAISRALIAAPKLILMDEPSMGLAPVLVDRVMDAIDDINRRGMTVLLVEQNAQAALAIADRVYILRSGRVVASGAASDFTEGDTVAKAYLA
jgi:branched-chain amino acid transport system permease protein